jgi:antibiotic biosynthesis monooxygenase (ABM) superfamily enzyme
MIYSAAKNSAMSFFAKGSAVSEAAHAIRARASNTDGTPQSLQRAAVLQIAVALMETEVDSYVERGIKEWYEAHQKPVPSPATDARPISHPV